MTALAERAERARRCDRRITWDLRVTSFLGFVGMLVMSYFDAAAHRSDWAAIEMFLAWANLVAGLINYWIEPSGP
jgi:hypothetical protein